MRKRWLWFVAALAWLFLLVVSDFRATERISGVLIYFTWQAISSCYPLNSDCPWLNKMLCKWQQSALTLCRWNIQRYRTVQLFCRKKEKNTCSQVGRKQNKAAQRNEVCVCVCIWQKKIQGALIDSMPHSDLIEQIYTNNRICEIERASAIH